jgi:hypothetical protein
VPAEGISRGQPAIALHEQQLHRAQPSIKAALEGRHIPGRMEQAGQRQRPKMQGRHKVQYLNLCCCGAHYWRIDSNYLEMLATV